LSIAKEKDILWFGCVQQSGVVKLTQNISFLVIKKKREYYNKIFSKKIPAPSFTLKKIVLQILWLKLQWVRTGKKGLDKCIYSM
jgi:hypothetical protein